MERVFGVREWADARMVRRVQRHGSIRDAFALPGPARRSLNSSPLQNKSPTPPPPHPLTPKIENVDQNRRSGMGRRARCALLKIVASPTRRAKFLAKEVLLLFAGQRLFRLTTDSFESIIIDKGVNNGRTICAVTRFGGSYDDMHQSKPKITRKIVSFGPLRS